jgi:hypothetical protein
MSAKGWSLATFVAAVVYALSIGPVAALDSFNVFSPTQWEWVERFYYPLDWSCHRLSLDSLLAQYVGWWQEVFHKR